MSEHDSEHGIGCLIFVLMILALLGFIAWVQVNNCGWMGLLLRCVKVAP